MSAETQLAARAWRLAVAVLAVIALIAPTAAISQDFESVKQRRQQLQSEIDTVTAELEQLHARIAETRDQLETLNERKADLRAEAESAKQALAQRARTSFMGGSTGMSTFESLLSANGPTSALERASLLEALSRGDVTSLEQARALRERIEQNRQLLTAKTDELDRLRERAQERASELQDKFAAVSEVYQDLKQRKERQLKITRGLQNGTYACIFDGPHHFRDTWGAPRSGGRSHEGTDLFAPYGAPVYAFTDGHISRMNKGGLGGVKLYIDGDDGVEYFYAHLSGYADSAYVGKRVEAGELVAYNGGSGNADRWAPHVHFEVHPGGGAPTNPYPWVNPAC